MTTMDTLVIVVSACFSILLPVVIISIRETVKSQRQGFIRDLEKVFSPHAAQGRAEDSGRRDLIVPSFEFLKFKYFVPEDAGAASAKRTKSAHDIPIWAFIVASLPLILILFALGIVTFGFLLANFVYPRIDLWFLVRFYSHSEDAPLWLLVLITAYAGSYLYIIRSLLRSVANFELSPAILLSSTVHVIFGAVTAILVAVASKSIPGVGTLTALVVIMAFAVGFVPELGLRALLRATELSLFKREDESVYRAFSATPVEVIDGIDSEIRSRLSDFHINTVQNLATANPIMLFIETPYGIYQIIDWVAQAQLCAIVGPSKLTQFWKMGIRTVYDLERVVLDDGFTTPQLRSMVGAILLNKKEDEVDDHTVVALVQVMTDDLHIQRLRQIWNRIADRLDTGNLELIKVRARLPKNVRPSAPPSPQPQPS